MGDTTLRQLKLLELLPRQPFKKSTQSLKENLSEIGFEVSKRTIQRDLKNLSSILPLISDERDKPYGWSWHKDAAGLNPSMDPIEALTFSLAQEYLEPLMPSKSFKRMNIFFERANNVLKEMDKSKNFLEKNLLKNLYIHGKNHLVALNIINFTFKPKIQLAEFSTNLKSILKADVPKFHIDGDYLKKFGMQEGASLGKALKIVENEWIENNFAISQNRVKEIIDIYKI